MGRSMASLEPAGVGYRDIAAYFDQGFSGHLDPADALRERGERRNPVPVDPGRQPGRRTGGPGGRCRSSGPWSGPGWGLEAGEGAPLSLRSEGPAPLPPGERVPNGSGGNSPGSLDLIPEPTQKEQRDRIRAIAAELRRADPAAYSVLADGVGGGPRAGGGFPSRRRAWEPWIPSASRSSVCWKRLPRVWLTATMPQRSPWRADGKTATGSGATPGRLAQLECPSRGGSGWRSVLASCLEEVLRVRGKGPLRPGPAYPQRRVGGGWMGWMPPGGLPQRHGTRSPLAGRPSPWSGRAT